VTDIENAPESTTPATSSDPKAASAEPAEAPTDYGNFEFVRFPDGTLHAVPKGTIAASQAQSNLPVVDEGPTKFYLWLSNGDVEMVDVDQVPPAGGAQSAHGYYTKDGHTYDVVAKYPVPHTLI